LPLLFFSLSTRQEYYVLPALPALMLLIVLWLESAGDQIDRINHRIAAILLVLGSLGAAICLYFAVHSGAPPANIDLADVLNQNPGDYALSMGHFLDLTG